jgi:hypothetical protein
MASRHAVFFYFLVCSFRVVDVDLCMVLNVLMHGAALDSVCVRLSRRVIILEVGDCSS